MNFWLRAWTCQGGGDVAPGTAAKFQVPVVLMASSLSEFYRSRVSTRVLLLTFLEDGRRRIRLFTRLNCLASLRDQQWVYGWSNPLIFKFIFIFFWVRSWRWFWIQYLAQAGFELIELCLPLLPKCQDWQCAPPCPARPVLMFLCSKQWVFCSGLKGIVK